MTLATHLKKRIEIMIEAAAVDRITDVLDREEATGYTILPALGGKGAGGSWTRDDVFAASARMVCIVCITDESRVDAILTEIKDLVDRYIGIVTVANVQVIRSDHF